MKKTASNAANIRDKPARCLMGQSRRFDRPLLTSDLPPETDIVRVGRHVSKVPTHKVAALQPAAREQEPRGRWGAERLPVSLERSRPGIQGVVNLTQEGAPNERD